jgi:hypothetical protein
MPDKEERSAPEAQNRTNLKVPRVENLDRRKRIITCDSARYLLKCYQLYIVNEIFQSNFSQRVKFLGSLYPHKDSTSENLKRRLGAVYIKSGTYKVN